MMGDWGILGWGDDLWPKNGAGGQGGQHIPPNMERPVIEHEYVNGRDDCTRSSIDGLVSAGCITSEKNLLRTNSMKKNWKLAIWPIFILSTMIGKVFYSNQLQ